MSERNTHTNRTGWMAVIAVILFVAIAVLPVAAATLPGYRHIFIKPENGIRFDKIGNETYYFKLEGAGTNALHITNDPRNATSGQITTTTSTNGTFWLSDTGGRGFDDDAILLIAVNGTPGSNFHIHITSSGYNWTPTGVINQIPDIGAIAYNASAVNNAEFDTGNYLDDGNDPSEEIIQAWKPSTSSDYPIFSGEDVSNSGLNDFRLIPVDLKVGIIGTGTNVSYYSSLTDWGAAKVDYSIEDLGSAFVVFNGYAYTNQSNQGQGVSWTNKVNAYGQSSSGASGWLVKPS